VTKSQHRTGVLLLGSISVIT